MPDLFLSAEAAFHMAPEPVCCCRALRIVYRNPAFAAAFPQLREGDALPEHWGCEGIPSSGVIPGWSLLCWEWADGVILRLNRIDPPAALSDSWLPLLSQRLRQPLSALTLAQSTVEEQLSPFLQKGCEEGFGRLSRARMQLLRLCGELELVGSGDTPFGFTPQSVDLDGLCRDTAAQLEGVLEQTHTRLVYRGCNRNLPAQCDDLLVQTLLFHLISNSIRQQPGGARLELHLDQRGEMAQISLLDDGPGMSPHQLASAFSLPQGELTDEDALQGLRLGLVVCRQIALLHQGSLLLSNRTGGRGLQATFSLPLCGPEDAQSLETARRLDASGGVPLVLRELSVVLPEQCYRSGEM